MTTDMEEHAQNCTESEVKSQLSRRPQPRDDVEKQKEEADKADDEVAHQLAVALAGIHHDIDALEAAGQQPSGTVKVTILSNHTNISDIQDDHSPDQGLF